MVIKILKAAGVYEGIRYNTRKIENDKAELMKTENFGALNALGALRPEDYIRYLELISAQNTRIRLPQFHAVLSAKGRSFSKTQLTKVAGEWMKSMGYGEQPYLIIYHKDTQNNHVHIVSTRINKEGKKICSVYEKIRAVRELNKLIGLNEKLKAKTDLEKALGYNFSTTSQFMMLLEAQGYVLQETPEVLYLVKYGKRLCSLKSAQIQTRIKERQVDQKRIAQLRLVFEKYRHQYSSKLVPLTAPLPGGRTIEVPGKYTSDLAIFLREKFGVELFFHSSEGKPVYGYSIIDHSEKQVLKGSEVMRRDVLLEPVPLLSEKLQTEYLNNSETLASPDVTDTPEDFYEHEDSGNDFEEISEELREYIPHTPDVNVSISDDIDDEAINGRNRRKKKKARTNTR
ncbi:relaxase/mobilization nuclease domain-containing protein [Pedobacter hiemivivus]|uniref:MobA/VirD2-like nuclease domain-containing protein n=1 Tax=Pedobacter hiemivivus TaxID=2530454 RepID=A0A4R0NED4_9SPHI|nr:relaxase/mobilization nuclease domain-containing protein [Pedobacter hiemivivus]TCC98791.1 hypothetical protein EZ444_05820 [Pedobacter hiemivivus]